MGVLVAGVGRWAIVSDQPAQRPTNPLRPQPTSGFPSPADGAAESRLDVRDLLAPRPISTFYLRMRGDRLASLGVFSGDVVVIDRSLSPHVGQLVIVTTNGELRLTRWQSQADAANIDADMTLWGVVTYIIHKADALGSDTTADALDIE